MPRKPRIHVPGAYYHVTLRGNHRQDIFFCDAHRQWLDDIVAKAMERCGENRMVPGRGHRGHICTKATLTGGAREAPVPDTRKGDI